MRTFLMVGLVLSVSAGALAQPVPGGPAGTPESSRIRQEEMGDVMEQMGPMMQTMMEGMYTAMFRVLARRETASNLASFTRNYYEELKKKGFTDDQALKIVVGMGFPQMRSVQ